MFKKVRLQKHKKLKLWRRSFYFMFYIEDGPSAMSKIFASKKDIISNYEVDLLHFIFYIEDGPSAMSKIFAFKKPKNSYFEVDFSSTKKRLNTYHPQCLISSPSLSEKFHVLYTFLTFCLHYSEQVLTHERAWSQHWHSMKVIIHWIQLQLFGTSRFGKV